MLARALLAVALVPVLRDEINLLARIAGGP